MTDTTQEELPPLPVGAGFYLDEYSQKQMQDYAHQCIATLRAENARLKEELSQFWFQERTMEQRGEEYAAWKRQCTVAMLASKSQAAAMAGLLEEASTALRLDTTRKSQSDLQFVCADKIDAALAAWKETS